MPTLTVTNEQLRLIQKALDMYSRIAEREMAMIDLYCGLKISNYGNTDSDK